MLRIMSPFNTRGTYRADARVLADYMLRYLVTNCAEFACDNDIHRGVIKHGLRLRYTVKFGTGGVCAPGVLLPFILHIDLFPQRLKRANPSELYPTYALRKFRRAKKLTAVSSPRRVSNGVSRTV